MEDPVISKQQHPTSVSLSLSSLESLVVDGYNIILCFILVMVDGYNIITKCYISYISSMMFNTDYKWDFAW
jgi:hypothetical protein